MKIEKDKIFNTILAIVVVVLVFHASMQFYSLHKYKRYTIGYTIKKEKKAKGGTSILYYYHVNGKKYEGRDRYHKGIKYPNERYYILFSHKRPRLSQFVHREVHDSIQHVPPEGWDKIPNSESSSP